ncbi:MAG: formylglycine-generating enzyme family protein, partial [Anaerolineae bacterium]|nr:formylglycine-generating enzyme family protein [Anaerolineae bacterium]
IPSTDGAGGDRLPIEPDMVVVPAGDFIMGSDPATDPESHSCEQPQHTVRLAAFAIARTPVTNAEYGVFLRATRHTPPAHWRIWRWKRRWHIGKQDHPVVNVTWYDAVAYGEWLAKETGKPYRLPSEAEWEKAARGPEGRRYPWGDAWLPEHCNSLENNPKGGTTPVTAFPEGASPYGLLDMAGNVWEWTRSLWGENLRKPDFPYPYVVNDQRENLHASELVRRILRGASFYHDRWTSRCAARYRYSPENRFDSVGFRVALALPPQS